MTLSINIVLTLYGPEPQQDLKLCIIIDTAGNFTTIQRTSQDCSKVCCVQGVNLEPEADPLRTKVLDINNIFFSTFTVQRTEAWNSMKW